MKVVEIYKSESLEVLLGSDIIINNYGRTEEDVICELVDELKKPYSFKFDWFLIAFLITASVYIPYNIYTGYNFIAIFHSILVFIAVFLSDTVQKFHFGFKNKIIADVVLGLSKNQHEVINVNEK